jgi:hypothetical protein
MASMLASLARIPRILAMTWPALLAWYLVGQVVRSGIIALAAPIGPESPISAMLLVPIAVLARLVSYVGMFLVLRRAMTGYREISGGDVSFTSFRDAAREFMSVLTSSIGPFFTLYAIIGLLFEDLSAYARATMRYSLGAEHPQPLNAGDSPIVLIVVVAAFTLRLVMRILGPKLPAWSNVFGIYLDATWVFLALATIQNLFGGALAWIQARQVVHWINDAQAWLVSVWEPIQLAIEGIGWVVPVAAQVILLPMAWLLVAGIIYVRAIGNIETGISVPKLPLRLVGAAPPDLLRRWRHIIVGGWEDVAGPVVLSGRMILRGRILDLALFVSAYGLLWAGSQWLARGVYTLIGPHDGSIWWDIDAVVAAGIGLITEPLRVVLLAAAFDFYLRRWSRRSGGAQSVKANLSSSPPSTPTSTSTTASEIVPSGAKYITS